MRAKELQKGDSIFRYYSSGEDGVKEKNLQA